MNSGSAVAAFYVADWLVEPRSNTLVCDEESVRVEPKAMRVLALLAANAGHVVTRQELEDSIWSDMVVGPDSLTNTVIKLRRALGDDARNPRIIETIPKTGYRLIAHVRVIESEDSEPPLERRLSAILYADVAEYSRLTGEDEERTHRRLSANLDRFSDSIRNHNGSVVHYAGDAILAEFATVTEALSCAVQVQRMFHESHSIEADSSIVQFRIGINLGEVIVDRDDIYGDGVNIAARLEGLAEPGSICISESVYSAIGNKLPLDYEFMGEQTVKNIADPVRAYRVLFHPPEKRIQKANRSRIKTWAMASVLGLVAIGAIIFWQYFSIDVAQEKPTIAVLPFANVSVDPNEDYLAEGMTQDLITELSKISSIDVIAYTSVKSLINKEIDIREIGQVLRARYAVEGSIRRVGERFRINVQLVETTTGRHLWAERYDRQLEEFFQIQDELITRIVDKIAASVSPDETAHIKRLPTTSLEAYHYYLLAQQSGYINSNAIWLDARNFYEKAIELDPDFSEAHSGLARLAVFAWRTDMNDVISGARARKLAFESASRALEIDPANAQAYSVLAVIQLGEKQHSNAITSARQAVDLAPGSAQTHLDLGLVLSFSGDSKQAVEEVETALRLDPDSPDTMLYAGIVLFNDGQYERAIDILSKASTGRPSSEQLWTYLSASYGWLGSTENSNWTISRLLDLYPNMSLEYYRARDHYFQQPEKFEHYIRGLELAGLPQWPYDFQAPVTNRLKAKELRQLVEDKTWAGRHLNGVEFFQQISRSGSLAYRSENSFVTGSARLENDKYCHRFDSTVLDKYDCGYIYRNPQGSSDSLDEYVIVMPGTVRYFSITQ